jgi:hypothetical protein
MTVHSILKGKIMAKNADNLYEIYKWKIYMYVYIYIYIQVYPAILKIIILNITNKKSI